jgi:hypothetical protein
MQAASPRDVGFDAMQSAFLRSTAQHLEAEPLGRLREREYTRASVSLASNFRYLARLVLPLESLLNRDAREI